MNSILLLIPVSVLLRISQSVFTMLIFLFFLMPVIFQITTGLKALKGKIKIKFWMVSVVSIVSEILVPGSLMVWMLHNMKKYGIRDGLGFVFVEFLGVVMITIIILVIAIQWLIHRNRKTTNTVKPTR